MAKVFEDRRGKRFVSQDGRAAIYDALRVRLMISDDLQRMLGFTDRANFVNTIDGHYPVSKRTESRLLELLASVT